MNEGRPSGEELPVAHLRKEYSLGDLTLKDLDPDAIRQFQKWLETALQAGVPEPNAMTLATVDEHGQPSARVVLLKGIDARGFAFFTNYKSRKGRELAKNPHAALVFYWTELERQVCVAGQVERLSRAEAQAYFASRPRGNRLGAWVSKQSTVIANREVLEAKLAELEKQYPGQDIPMPEAWGGYILNPSRIEFWQGRPNRLHDRFLYTRLSSGGWRIERLSP
jgi:pyridoxamine 5'-phosphate oxidase